MVSFCGSDFVIVKIEANVSWPLGVSANKVLVARRPLCLVVAGEHALQAHTHALHIVDGAPALAIKQVEADDSVAVDMRV